ncbi:ABC transporter ATP-binding protein [Kribbella catacumbae]|uniref:ABC transporter ATP-binding protein n=1 Tax=Kribbella catacumbae TaxID=460086 RepID=UPI000382B70F|nr:ABC transporter ATP-binding protein [Kribbella catacumbae]
MSLTVDNVVVRYRARRPFADVLLRRPGSARPAVDGVRLTLNKGEVVALVGESGSGKSTLARCLAGMQELTSGRVTADDIDLTTLRGGELKTFRQRVQMIFQDPYESLSPRQRVKDIVAEGLAIHGVPKAAREARVNAALVAVGLTPVESFLDRRPFELSGGQRQRVAIAGSLVLEPDYLIADEPVSMLDVSIRAGVLKLLHELRESRELGVLLITHDLATAVHVADHIAVMQAGRIVEQGPAAQVTGDPAHEYTRALLAATPDLDRAISA